MTTATQIETGPTPRGIALGAVARTAIRWLLVILLALGVFGLVLLLFGRNPIAAYRDIFQGTLASTYGVSEVMVRMIPLIFCALAVLLPARIGLVSVGGEGQLYMGAWLATAGALAMTDAWPRLVALPLVIVLAFVGGGLWALIPAVLRAKGWLNETISTLLLNYVAILVVNYFIFGAWRDPESANFPQTEVFVAAARFPQFGGTRVHLGLILALAATLLIFLVLRYTLWGYDMRCIGGNAEASARYGLPLTRYILIVMFVAGGMAGLAGAGEIFAIQGRLRPAFSPGYGYMGFLISWLAGHNPLGVIVMSFLLALLAVGGDTLQITQSMPYSTINILMALILFIVLGGFFRRR